MIEYSNSEIRQGRELLYKAYKANLPGLQQEINQKIDFIKTHMESNNPNNYNWEEHNFQVNPVVGNSPGINSGNLAKIYADFEKAQLAVLAKRIVLYVLPPDDQVLEASEAITAYFWSKLPFTKKQMESQIDRVVTTHNFPYASLMNRFHRYGAPRLIKFFHKILNNKMLSTEEKHAALQKKEAERESIRKLPKNRHKQFLAQLEDTINEHKANTVPADQEVMIRNYEYFLKELKAMKEAESPKNDAEVGHPIETEKAASKAAEENISVQKEDDSITEKPKINSSKTHFQQSHRKKSCCTTFCNWLCGILATIKWFFWD
jgi:hypothetical protein